MSWTGEPLEVMEAFDRLNSFADDYGPASTLLALHVAVLERFRADIVAQVRLNFLPKSISSDTALDADVLFGPLSWHLGDGYFTMDHEVRRQCLITLDVWGAKQGDDLDRSRRAARFVRRYVNWIKRNQPLKIDPVFADYLNVIEWVALGFDDPNAAARALARVMKTQLDDQSRGKSGMQLTAIASVLRLPMAAFMDELNYARAIDALSADDYERAVKLVSARSNREFQIGGIKLPPPQEMLDRFRERQALAALFGTPVVAGPGDGPLPSIATGTGLSLDLKPITVDREISDSPLHQAIKAGDREAVLRVLSSSPDLVNVPGIESKTALHLAAEQGNSDFVKLLLDASADPNAKDVRYNSPLHIAAENGRYSVSELLLDCAHLDARNAKGCTPLVFAVFNGHLDVAKLLIKKGAAVDPPNDFGYAPIAFAVYAGRLLMVQLLLSHPVDLRRIAEHNIDLMYLAAWGGRLAIVEKLLELGLPINGRDRNGWTPFLIAVFSGHTAVMELLIEMGANVDGVQNDGWTALHLASQQGHTQIISKLIQFGARLDPVLRHGHMPLHIAVIHDRAAAAATLIEAGADLRGRVGGVTPFLLACSRGNDEIIRLMLAQSNTDVAATDARGATALQLAIEGKSAKAVRALLEDSRTDCNVINDHFKVPPLWQAADGESWEIFELLCRDPRTNKDWKDQSGETQLHRSAQQNQLAAVNELLASGAQVDPVNRKLETPLFDATFRSHVNVIRALLAHGADPDVTAESSHTPLTTAVKAGSEEAIPLIVKAGAKLNWLDPGGNSLLHQAAELKNHEVVDLLVSLGLQSDIRNDRQVTPLHVAAGLSDQAMVQTFLRLGSNVNSRDRDGLNPLHYALRRGNLETAKELLSFGADVNAKTLNGWTALHFAAQRHLGAAVDLLISNGAKVDELSNDPPMTPLQVAAESGAAQAAQVLLLAGADPDAANSIIGPPLVLAVRNGHHATALALLASGAALKVQEPSSGLDALDVFRGRRSRRELAGEQASEGELELAQLLASPARLKTPVSLSEVSPTTFAPLESLQFDDPDKTLSTTWRALRGKDRVEFLESIKTDELPVFREESTQVLWQIPSFYENVALIRVRDQAWAHPRQCLFYLKKGSDLKRLIGSSPPIHEMNASSPIRLDEHNVLDYVRFFGFLVRGEEGPFHVLESVDDPVLMQPREIPDDVLSAAIRPAEFKGWNESGNFVVEAIIAYAQALFVSDFVVRRDGLIEMLSDNPLIAGTQPLVDAPI